VIDRIKLRLQSRSWLRLARGSKWVAAGGLLFNPDGHILLIKHRLRNTWEYPAGASDGRESPIETCRREVAEEVGLDIERYRLIGIDFFHRATPNGNLLFTFAAEVSYEHASSVKPQILEVAEYRWVDRSQALELIAPRLNSRLRELLAAYDSDKPVYLHTGEPVI
jgi:8-oxo-dGTP diphosphatase